MRSASPDRTDFSACSDVLFAHSGRLLHERFQHLGLPNKEVASIRSLDTVVTIHGSLAKGMLYKHNKGERALAIFYEGSFPIIIVIYPVPFRHLVVRSTLYI